MINLSSRRVLVVIAIGLLLASCRSVAVADPPPSLPGTNWQLLSLTTKDEPIKDAENPADVQFLKDGTWSILHYGGMLQGGKYEVKADQLTMKTEDNDVYMDGKMNFKPTEKVLEINDGTYLMRLRRLVTK